MTGAQARSKAGGRFLLESDTMIVFQNYPLFPLPHIGLVSKTICTLNW